MGDMQRNPKTYGEFKKAMTTLNRFLALRNGHDGELIVKWYMYRRLKHGGSIALVIAMDCISPVTNTKLTYSFWNKTKVFKRTGQVAMTLDVTDMCESDFAYICKYHNKHVNQFTKEIEECKGNF